MSWAGRRYKLKNLYIGLDMKQERLSLKEAFDAQRFQRNDWVPEQERNFDANHTPSRSEMVLKGYEEIDGKMYKVWQP